MPRDMTAGTGSLTRIDIHGEGGQTIKDKYAGGPRTFLGIQSAGFPNLFIMPGAGAGNFTRGLRAARGMGDRLHKLCARE